MMNRRVLAVRWPLPISGLGLAVVLGACDSQGTSDPGAVAAVVRTVNVGMTHDIHVYLRSGTYDITSTITFGPQDSGTSGHTIYYEAYPGEVPTLNGATKVTGR